MRRLVKLSFALALTALGIGACLTEIEENNDGNKNEAADFAGSPDAPSGGSGASNNNTSGPSSGSGTTTPPGGKQPGDLCQCDAECATVEAHTGVCVYGVCMTRPSADCSAGGSTVECHAGSACWGLEGEEGFLCIPSCSSYDCKGGCDEGGACLPTKDTSCDYGCGSYCNCQTGDCKTGEQCIGGKCVPETMVGDGPGVGPGPECASLPQRDCTGGATYCGEIVVYDPRTTDYYDDYPINGETTSNQYRSYLRRDLMMLIAYASAKTLCKSAGWTVGNGGPIGLGDMSEKNGAIPGTSVGQPGHPKGTHTNGFDMDLGYYQQNTPDNKLRPICEHANYHCTKAPHLLDTWRNALFLGFVFESQRVRVVGVDGQAGQLMTSAIGELCKLGWLDTFACNHVKLAYEVTDMGYGWYYFHHHHQHVSMCPGNTPCNNLLDVVMPTAGAGWKGNLLKRNSHLVWWPAL
jgi:hypothetical protein